METKCSLNIQNVVVVAYIGQGINLYELINRMQAEYRPEAFPGAVYRIKEPKSTFLIFGKGKMVCVGTKSVEDAKKAVSKVVKTLNQNGLIERREYSVDVSNIVASCNFGYDFWLEECNRLYDVDRYKKFTYEPSDFPALILADGKKDVEIDKQGGGKVVISENATFLIYSQGKFICTGCKTEQSLKIRVDDLSRALFEIGLLVPREN